MTANNSASLPPRPRAGEAAEIVRRVQQFYRPTMGTPERGVVNLNRLVRDAVEAVRPRWLTEAQLRGRDIEVKAESCPTGGVAADQGELRESVAALLVNAVEALPEGGCVTLSTRQEGDRVVLDVQDTGAGHVRRRAAPLFRAFLHDQGAGCERAWIVDGIRYGAAP